MVTTFSRDRSIVSVLETFAGSISRICGTPLLPEVIPTLPVNAQPKSSKGSDNTADKQWTNDIFQGIWVHDPENVVQSWKTPRTA
jgi:hypothetical protein